MASRTEDVGRNLETFLLELKRQIPLPDAESEGIKDLRRRVDLENRQDLREEINRLKKENEELKHKEELNRQGKDERLNRKYDETKAANLKLKDEIDVILAEKLSLEDACDNQNFKIKDLERTIQNTEKQAEVDKLQIQSKYKNIREKLERTEKELEDTKLRAYMGHQLSDNNPNIADLSDQTRPTKIGEMFSSLYDDEYTNAFEEIDVDSTDNKDTCEKLLRLLMDAKKFCDDKAEEQLRALKRECLGQESMNTSMDSSLVDYSLKEMKEIRKKNAKKSMKKVYDKFAHHMIYTKKSSIFLHPHRYAKTIEYGKRCVEVCWLMAVQDPPLMFGPMPQMYDGVDKNLYKFYTKTGTWVDFVLWPVLYLHDNGAVLCKGVLEAIKEVDVHGRHYTEGRHHDHDNYGRNTYDDIERRHINYDTERTQHLTRRLVSPSDVQVSSSQEDDLDYPSLRRDTPSTSYLSQGYHHVRSDRVTPTYQQETLPTQYRQRYSPKEYSHHSTRRTIRSDRPRVQGWKY